VRVLKWFSVEQHIHYMRNNSGEPTTTMVDTSMGCFESRTRKTGNRGRKKRKQEREMKKEKRERKKKGKKE